MMFCGYIFTWLEIVKNLSMASQNFCTKFISASENYIRGKSKLKN